MSVKTTYRTLVRKYPKLLSPLHRSALKVLHQYKKVRNKPAENVLDNIGKTVQGDICTTVDEFQGEFYLDSRSALFRRIARDGFYEPTVTSTCLKYIDPEQDVIDIGANIGFYTVLFSKNITTGRVLSIEPTSGAYQRLVKNIAHNQLSENIEIFNGAVSDSVSSQEIKVIEGREEFSTLGSMTHQAVTGEEWKIEHVQCDTIDNLVDKHDLKPGLIKMDVEGMEHVVFKGCLKTLESHRPVVITELSDLLLQNNGSSAKDVLALFTQFNYQVCSLIDPKIPVGEDAYGEVICIPN